MPPSRPNLVFIMTDHQRADSLGMVQAGLEVTPNLNRLAARGTLFTRAYSTCPLCVPARTALATGLYPTRNGVTTNDWQGTTAGDHPTLHELLHRQGYDVAHIGVHHIRVRPGLDTRLPFAAWEGESHYAAFLRGRLPAESPAESAPFKRLVRENQNGRPTDARYSSVQTGVWPGPADAFKDLYWSGRAAAFAAQPRAKPFALFLYLWAPHPPLRVPEPYASLFPPDRLDLPPNVGRPAEGEPSAYRSGVPAQLAEGVTHEDWRKVWAAHLGLVRLADTGIGRVLESLSPETAANTLILFTSDHGDHLGQHGMYQKIEMYEQALRIPLVLAGPGIRAQSVAAPVSHLDVLPTVLDLLGLPVPDGLDGLSLGPALRHGAPPPDRPIFAQYSGNPVPGDIRRCVIAGPWKYVWSAPASAELFHLADDPLEMRNLARAPEHRATLLHLHETCRQWGLAHADPVAAGSTPPPP
jgi:arylsulfatase A-like enzyme